MQSQAGRDSFELTPRQEIRLAHVLEEPEGSVNVANAEPVPPNGGYGWVIVFAVFMMNAHTWGINASWAVIMAYYSLDSGQLRASHFTYAIIGGLSISQALLIAPAISWSQKLVGTRMTLLLGTALVFVSLLTSSFVTSIWQLVLSQGICFGWGMGLVYVTSASILPSWFSTRRSLAVGIASSGAGIGGLAYSLATNLAIQNVGVQWTYRILACCSLLANAISSLLVRETGSKAIVANPVAVRSFRYRDFGHLHIILVLVWGVATEFGYITLMYSLPSFAFSIGLSATQGSIVNALLNLGLGFGRPFIGYFSDTFGRINIATLLTAMCALFCFALWIPAQNFPLLCVFAVTAGSTCGIFWCTVTPVIGEVVGIPKLASTFRAICLALVLPTTFAEVVAIELADTEGGVRNFRQTQIFVAFMFLTGAICMWLLRGWKMFHTEQQQQQQSSAVSSTAGSQSWIGWLAPRFFFRVRHV
ncbi:MFS transporter [Stachybotrys elegans]|uniref:MFS transporter n=1 Tax=Stachybotrys elegans TaxID=80388 RepID=A0A8K0WJ11_9HYPO|nr:MFS transporter [Stachybotrys elegans]